jgi:hypothetical protein
MRRQLAELDRLDRLDVLALQGAAAHRRPARSSGPQRGLAIGVAGVLVGSGALFYDEWWEMAGPIITGRPPEVRTVTSDVPLGVAPTKASNSTDYAFMDTRSGFRNEPVTFDPCKVIHIVVNTADAPTGAEGLLREAVARVSAASGLVFTIEGTTTEPPSKNRPSRDVGRYGNRPSPVLVAWTNPTVVPELEGNIAGIGGPVPDRSAISTSKRWVSGIVYLDGPSMSKLLQRSSRGWAQARAIVMHELAHVIGLTHVQSRAELMHAKNDAGILDWGPGDREGLRLLGSGPCG